MHQTGAGAHGLENHAAGGIGELLLKMSTNNNNTATTTAAGGGGSTAVALDVLTEIFRVIMQSRDMRKHTVPEDEVSFYL